MAGETDSHERAAQGSEGWLPPLLGSTVWLVLVQVLAYTALRLAFFLAFHGASGELRAADLGEAFWLGARFDLRLALLVALPILLLGAAGPLRPCGRRAARLWRAWIVGAGLLVSLVYLLDFGHYDYLHERLDAAVLDELRSPASC